ncbi:MAG: hypothetical protein A4E53_01164 [Pelotomaculum sp. PtaB.Bin104]|nr:MAG: hypothetical protein A4E53_01164 [Pelotomaculum sp. PtaB.Bin104]
MGLDNKQKVLLAIYLEYQKDIPNMRENINSNIIGGDFEMFAIALAKLLNERLITGADFSRGGRGNKILHVFTDNIKITVDGINYVEQKLEIEKTLTGPEKVREVADKGIKWGWEQAKDFAAKVLAEMLK